MLYVKFKLLCPIIIDLQCQNSARFFPADPNIVILSQTEMLLRKYGLPAIQNRNQILRVNIRRLKLL